MVELPADWAARVRAARAYADYENREDFAGPLDVSPSTVKNYETGRSTPPTMARPETIKQLVKVSGLPEWFFTVPRLDSPRLGVAQTETDQRLRRIEELLIELQREAAEAAVRDAEALAQIEGLRTTIQDFQDGQQQ